MDVLWPNWTSMYISGSAFVLRWSKSSPWILRFFSGCVLLALGFRTSQVCQRVYWPTFFTRYNTRGGENAMQRYAEMKITRSKNLKHHLGSKTQKKMVPKGLGTIFYFAQNCRNKISCCCCRCLQRWNFQTPNFAFFFSVKYTHFFFTGS